MSKKYTKAPSERINPSTRDKLIGLGERSIRKTYYPELQQRMRELERFRALLDEAGDAIFLVDSVNARIFDCNRSACEQLGYRRDELLHRPFIDLVPSRHDDTVIKYLNRDAPGASALSVELLTRQGNCFPAEMTIRSKRLDKSTYAVIVARDITQRMKAEEALRRTEEKYRSIYENAQVGIFQTTPGGHMFSANPALARILGYDSPRELTEQLTDIKNQLYVDPGERERFLKAVKSHQSVTDFTTRFRKKDGSIIWVNYDAHPVTDENGRLLYFEGTLQDITESKKAAEEKAALEEQLRQAQKMDALGKLTGGIAHDFNNLLQAISGYVQLLLMKKATHDPDHKYLIEINRATERASSIVRRLLAFSRKMEVQLQPVNLNDVVSTTLKLLEHTTPKMITLQSNLEADLKTIQADPVQLEQVVMNLASNAIDAMPDGGQLFIETSNVLLESEYRNRYLEVEPGEYVCLRVTDTGQGLDGETRKRIFEPFFTTKEVSKGTGLGLSITYGIVKGHLGHITCYSEPGLGTTFKVYLPVSERPADTATVEEQADTGPPPRGSETILLVDDEEMILDIGEEMLSDFGYAIRRARSGEEALEIYCREAEDIGLVVLDLGMPGMGGEKCLEGLLAFDPSVKVIVASGYGAHAIAKNPEAFGAAAFISKPYPFRDMLFLVREVLDRR